MASVQLISSSPELRPAGRATGGVAANQLPHARVANGVTAGQHPWTTIVLVVVFAAYSTFG